MRNSFKILLVVLLGVSNSCKKDDATPMVNPVAEVPALAKIIGINQDKSFVDTNGESFFPWGFNYTNVNRIGLLEDNWEQESTWDIIAEDFAEMKGYSANVVRLHLQFNKFMINATTPDQVALQRLQRLVKIAEDNGLYLDITGLASYRRSDSPEWYDALNDDDRWAAHVVFWKNVAAAIGDSNAVFAYNLMNEPVVSVGCENTIGCDWLPGNSFGGFQFVQNIARNPDLVFTTAMKDWIGTLTTAIRSEDHNTMITVGFLGLGSITQFEGDLDYLSIHLYPKSGELQLSIDKVMNNQSSSPLILEETANLFCSIDELQTFVNQIDGMYNGLMGHYSGKTVEELEASGTIPDALSKNFIDFFIANDPN